GQERAAEGKRGKRGGGAGVQKKKTGRGRQGAAGLLEGRQQTAAALARRGLGRPHQRDGRGQGEAGAAGRRAARRHTSRHTRVTWSSTYAQGSGHLPPRSPVAPARAPTLPRSSLPCSTSPVPGIKCSS